MTSSEPQGVALLGSDPGMAAGGRVPVAVPPPSPRPADGAPAAPRLARGGDLFARYTRDYVAGRFGQPVAVLFAGCTTACDLGTDPLRAEGADITVSLIDDDHPVTRAVVESHPALSPAVLGDMRTIPLPPRAFDIVQCALLERIRHTELVLDRLVAAIRPGGLLLLRVRDRDSAAAFLDRMLPRSVRQAIAHGRRPGARDPHPAIYERLSSVRGVQAYALLRGLVIAERQALGGLAGGTARAPRGYLAAQKLVDSLSRGRFTAAHEELLVVLRKPENRFARVL